MKLVIDANVVISALVADSETQELNHFLNGYRFEYDERIKTILKWFGTDEAAVDEEEIVEYLRSHTEELDLAGKIEEWRDGLIQYGVEQLTGDSSDPND